MGPEEAIELINAQLHATYRVAAQLGGSSQSVYRVEDQAGAVAVLKTSRNPRWGDQVRRGLAATAHLAKLGYPVPQYLAIGSTDHGSYWLETQLPGAGLTAEPSVDQVSHLMALIDLQQGQMISEVQGQDWVWYISEVVFRGESGNVRSLMQFSPETSAIVADAEALVVGLQGKMLPKTDLVHGSFSVSQVLFQDQAISGVVNWDQAGYGDRTIDLVGLWYSVLQATGPRDSVMQHMLQVSDSDAVKIYAVNKIVSQIAWHINMVGGNVSEQVVQARKALDILKLI